MYRLPVTTPVEKGKQMEEKDYEGSVFDKYPMLDFGNGHCPSHTKITAVSP